MEQFCIHFHEEKNGMTCNIALTALDYPSRSCVKNWDLGVDDGYLSSLLSYWRYDYDWSRKEAELNRFYAYCVVKEP